MQNPSPAHQRLVGALITHFQKKLGYRITSAAYGDFPRPDSHGRHEPDIVAVDGRGVLHLAEAKADSSDIASEHAGEQFIDFSNRIMKDSGVQVPFHIVVYKSNEAELLSRLHQMGLGSMVGNRIKIWTL